MSRMATARATNPATWADSGDFCRATVEPTDRGFPVPELPPGAGLGDEGLIWGNSLDASPAPMSEVLPMLMSVVVKPFRSG